MRRIIASFLLVAAVSPGTWLRDPATLYYPKIPVVRFTALTPPAPAEQALHLGPFTLDAVWQMTSPDYRFGGYSALLLHDGEFLAIGDRGHRLHFAPPTLEPDASETRPVTIDGVREWRFSNRDGYDSESATVDPVTRRIWIGWESSNSISRHDRHLHQQGATRPAAMREWGQNSGPEAMTRLADGRFVVLREGFNGWLEDRRHRALVFAGDPVSGVRPQIFTLLGPDGFSPVDMAQLPDGRVLILMRRLLWPIPTRFAARIAIADPAEIREGGLWRARVVAKLSSSLPVDNFEGMAIAPRPDGKLAVWLISDANSAVSQRTLLWKLVVDPSNLP